MRSPLFDTMGGRPILRRLLHHFYADVRQHRLLAPVFNAHVRDWSQHLETIADFWAGVSGGPAAYAGRMPEKHVLLGLREEHFQAWLGLWEHNCRVWLPEESATGMIALAHQIAARLRRICG